LNDLVPIIQNVKFKPRTFKFIGVVDWLEWSGFKVKKIFIDSHCVREIRTETVEFPYLKDLVNVYEVKSVVVDIRDVEGVTASGSSECNYETLDELAQFCRPNWFYDSNNDEEKYRPWDNLFIENETLEELLSHNKNNINIVGRSSCCSPYSLRRYSWTSGYLWGNSGGSHHFAAARYLANELNIKVYIETSLTEYIINKDVHDRLFKNFAIYFMNNAKVYENLANLLLSKKIRLYKVSIPTNIQVTPNDECSYFLIIETSSIYIDVIKSELKKAGIFALEDFLKS